MPDYDDDDNDSGEGQPNWRRKLEADAKAGREASAKLAEAEAASKAERQELAMRRAGIDPETPQAQMFAKANSEVLDVDTLKSEWDRVFPTGGQRPTPDAAAMQRISNASGQDAAASGGYVPDFESSLDEIPIIVDGNYNPNYVNEVLGKVQAQAVNEGREFVVDRSAAKFSSGNANTPAAKPIRQA